MVLDLDLDWIVMNDDVDDVDGYEDEYEFC
jgi:hypothetical protein